MANLANGCKSTKYSRETFSSDYEFQAHPPAFLLIWRGRGGGCEVGGYVIKAISVQAVSNPKACCFLMFVFL